MKIWKNLFSRNDKIHVDEIAVAPGLLLGGAVVVESGDGYIKHGDGHMVCYGKGYISGSGWMSGSFGGYYSPLLTLYFAKPFISRPTIAASISDGGTSARSAWLSYAYTSTSGNSVSFIASALAKDEARAIRVEYFAIGRWK